MPAAANTRCSPTSTCASPSRRSSGTCSARSCRTCSSIRTRSCTRSKSTCGAAVRAGARAARRAVDQAPLQARDAALEPLRPARRRGDRSLLGHLRGDAGRPRLDHPAHGIEPAIARLAARDADARQRDARRAAEEALRAAAVPQALRHQSEPARAPGQSPAGLRPRRSRWSRCSRSSAIASAPTRCCCSASRASARPRSPKALARRIEFEPDKVPVRLRDCQIVNLQMNTMVAGTMLRGMFEDRIQNVIREIKERPNLILFIDEVHTMIGAGSALGAPSDAANVFKSVLARGEVRDHRRDDARASTRSSSRKTKRWRAASAPCTSPSRRSKRRARILYSLRPRLERNYSVRSRTRRSRRRSRCRRATCATCSCPTRSSAGSTPRR